MIDIVGFWSSVTFIVGVPLWFTLYRLTRWILSIAKKSAPEIPMELRQRGSWGHWDRKLYPKWAHNLNYRCGGAVLDTGNSLILGILSFVPFIMLAVGALHPHETVIKVIVEVSHFVSTPMGWVVATIGVILAGYLGVSKGSRLMALVQLQEMKEKHRESKS